LSLPGRRSARIALRLSAAALLLGPAALPIGASAGVTAPRASATSSSAGKLVTDGDPAPAVRATQPDGGGTAGAATPAGPTGPSIQYLDTLAHEHDKLAFVPGDRVTVGFTPRPADTWTVDGGRPVSLPAGRVSGHELAVMPDGSVWAGSPPPRLGTPDARSAAAPIDEPMGPSLAATSAAYRVAAAAGAPTGGPGAPVSPDGLRREVLGFLPYWQVSDSSTTLDWSVLSTVAYFSVGADKYGNLLKQNSDGSVTTGWGGWTSSRMTSIINAAHQNGTRVVLTISVFAWTSGQAATQSALLGSATARANLAKQVAAAVAERGADGVNLDFEPIATGYADEFNTFVHTMRSELDAIHAGYQLTFDTTGYIGNYPIEAATATGGADAIFIMGYDYRTASSPHAGSISPLSGPAYDLTDTVAAYTARVAPSKLILGVPYYGRAWSTDSSALHATNISGTEYGASVTAVYTTAVGLATQYGRLYDSGEQAPWTEYQKQTCTTTYGCQTAWRQLYYDDAYSLKLRYDLVNRTALRGAGIWALGYDGTRPELYQALADKFLHDTTPPVVGINALSTTQTDAGFEVRWTGIDDSSIVGYDVQVAQDGGAWADWLVGTPSTSAIFLGSDGHAYAFRARGHDSHGNVSDWGVTSTLVAPSLAIGGFGTVMVDGLNLRSAPDTTSASLGTVNAGDALAITSGPTSAGGYTWFQVTGPVHEWAPVGDVQSGVWVAASSSGATYVQPRRPINATGVDAMIHGYGVGSGGTRLVTPNGDGITDSIKVAWVADSSMDSMVLNVWRSSGSLAGSVAVPYVGAGSQAFAWDGKVGGVRVPDGTYMLQLVGTRGGVTYDAPSAKPVSASQLAAFGVSVDHMPVTRLAGADRYATAVAVSKATYAAGVPVVYLATGLDFADALAGAPAAGLQKGPLLLVTASTIPAVVQTELARLKPARIVLLGGTSVISDAVKTAVKALFPS
jgi:spore germination protein YaaH